MSKETHAIVQFKKEYTRDGKQVIDLVPSSWFVKGKDGTYCLYPLKALNRMIRRWAEYCREPNPNWKKSEIKILQFAHDFSQGERRLLRYQKSASIESSAECGDIEESNSIDYEKSLTEHRNTSTNPINQKDILFDIPNFNEMVVFHDNQENEIEDMDENFIDETQNVSVRSLNSDDMTDKESEKENRPIG